MSVLENNVRPEASYAQNENRLLMLISVLSNFDLFSIQINGSKVFHATGIQLRKDHFLEFRKIFACPSFTDGKAVDCEAESDETFIVHTEHSTYSIRPLHKKPETLVNSGKREWKEIADLMQNSFFGSRLNTILAEENSAILVVDPYLLGELSEMEQYQIERIVNVYLDGKRQSLQIPRTVYFRVPYHSAENRIYAGIYDLANEKPITEKLIYQQDRMDEIDPVSLPKYQSLFYTATITAYRKSA